METETIAQYVAILKTTIDKLQCCRCFGRHATGLTSLWAARCSARESYCQRKTLPEKDLTFQRAIDVCQAHEEPLNLQRSPARLTRYMVCQSGRRVSSVDDLISQGIAHLRMLSVSHVVSEDTWQRFVKVS